MFLALPEYVDAQCQHVTLPKKLRYMQNTNMNAVVDKNITCCHLMVCHQQMQDRWNKQLWQTATKYTETMLQLLSVDSW